MRGDDLFPRHFIKALDPPGNYVGATSVFSPEGRLRQQMVRIVEDYPDILPLKHKKDHVLEELPPSLLEAIRAFVLVRAIRVLRGDGAAHCTMMINVSRFNDVQEKVEGLVFKYQTRLDNAIQTNAGLGDEATADPDMAALAQTFDREYGETEFSFTDILEALPEASRSIRVTTVNMRGGKLDYEARKKDGLHVIAIGGLALSRGLTLEGLSISYLLRNSAASDTLMQMARWFGYGHSARAIDPAPLRPVDARRATLQPIDDLTQAVPKQRGQLCIALVDSDLPDLIHRIGDVDTDPDQL